MDLKTDFDLLQQGDPQAFARIYQALAVPVYTIILRIVKQRDLAEDVVQELFLKLYQSPPQQPLRNPRAYLFQMAHHLAIDYLRGQKPTATFEDVPLDAVTSDQTNRLDLEMALAKLEPTESQIITFRINADLKFREIADILGMPLGTVLWKYKKAIQRLQLLLKENL